MVLKKILTFLSTFTILSISCSIVLSCKNNKEKYFTSDIGGLNDYFNPENSNNKNQKLIDRANNIRNGINDDAKKLLNQKIILISNGGKVNDNSFNQSSWEAISKFSNEIKANNNTFFEVLSMTQSAQNEAYDYALYKGYKIWVLTGFQQAIFFKNWLKIGKNKERFIKNDVKIVAVDWYDGSLLESGRILGLNFRTQEAAFVASYSLSKLLQEINLEDNNKYKQPHFTSFGGADISAVTNFNYGFYEGLRQFNEDNDKYKVKANNINLNTGFASTPDSRNKIKHIIDGYDNMPDVVLPVAGNLTANTIDIIKEKKSNQWVIGVDTNQALAFEKDKKYLLTSIEKKISIAVYKTIIALCGLIDNEDENSNIFVDTNYKINSKGLIVDSQNNLVNLNINKGYSSGFVGTSRSTLDSNLKFKNNKTYAQRYDEITKETWDEFYGEDKKSGRLNKSISEEKGLKPDQKVIDDFEKAITSEKQDSEKILALKNVLFGFMTFNNLNSYFVPIIKQINEGK